MGIETTSVPPNEGTSHQAEPHQVEPNMYGLEDTDDVLESPSAELNDTKSPGDHGGFEPEEQPETGDSQSLRLKRGEHHLTMAQMA